MKTLSGRKSPCVCPIPPVGWFRESVPSQGEVHKHRESSSSPCTVRSWVNRLGAVLKVSSMTKLGELERASKKSSVPNRKDLLKEVK